MRPCRRRLPAGLGCAAACACARTQARQGQRAAALRAEGCAGREERPLRLPAVHSMRLLLLLLAVAAVAAGGRQLRLALLLGRLEQGRHPRRAASGAADAATAAWGALQEGVVSHVAAALTSKHAAGRLGVGLAGVSCRGEAGRGTSRANGCCCSGAGAVQQGPGLDAAQPAAGAQLLALQEAWGQEAKRVPTHIQQQVASQAAKVQLRLRQAAGRR